MTRVSKCSLCASDKRKAVESDLIAGLSFGEVAQRHELNKSLVYRHYTRHMQDPVKDDDAEADVASLIRSARMALGKAQRRGDVKAMAQAMELLEGAMRLQSASSATGAADSDGYGNLSDEQLASKQRELLRVVRENSSLAELRAELADIQKVIESRQAAEAVIEERTSASQAEDITE